jgi:hypothetical protein
MRRMRRRRNIMDAMMGTLPKGFSMPGISGLYNSQYIPIARRLACPISASSLCFMPTALTNTKSKASEPYQPANAAPSNTN